MWLPIPATHTMSQPKNCILCCGSAPEMLLLARSPGRAGDKGCLTSPQTQVFWLSQLGPTNQYFYWNVVPWGCFQPCLVTGLSCAVRVSSASSHECPLPLLGLCRARRHLSCWWSFPVHEQPSAHEQDSSSQEGRKNRVSCLYPCSHSGQMSRCCQGRKQSEQFNYGVFLVEPFLFLLL